MKKSILTILLLFFLLQLLHSNELQTITPIENPGDFDLPNQRVRYNISGFFLSIGGFYKEFTVGLGYTWGSYDVFSQHYFGSDYGFSLEYNTWREFRLRVHYDAYGGSAGTLIGASIIMARDSNTFTLGAAPHIGIGFAEMKLYYRYNFFINRAFNSHEIILAMIF